MMRMKTIRLLYPDHVSGGLETYYFGAHLLAHILPANDKQPLIKVNVTPPDGGEKPIEDGIYGKPEVISGIQEAKIKLNAENPGAAPFCEPRRQKQKARPLCCAPGLLSIKYSSINALQPCQPYWYLP